MARKKYNGYLRKSFTHNGKRIYIYGKTPQDLLQSEIDKRKELEEEDKRIFEPTLFQYYEHFISVRKKEIRESTLRSQRCQFMNIAEVDMGNGTKFGDMRMKDITRRHIETARSILLEKGKTPQNLNNCFAHLNHVFANATLDDTIPKNPCKALKQLKRDGELIGENRHRALSVEETGKFFMVAKEKNSYYLNDFLMMINCGIRIGELTALFDTDIDRKNKMIHIRRSITRNDSGGYEVGEDAKTKSGVRDIPMTDLLYQIIKDQKELNQMIFGLKKDGLLFRSAEGDILREYSINREIKRLCKIAEIEPFTCHAFRNTFATRFIEQRPQDYKILSEILGHKDISITLNLYTHVMTENKVKAMTELSIKTI